MVKALKKVSFWLLWLILIALTILIVNTLVIENLLAMHLNFNEVIFETVSPDGKNRAVVFSRNLGATTGHNYQLSILRRNERLRNRSGNAFISYSQINVEWQNDETLVVELLENKRIFKQINEVSRISILYVYPDEFRCLGDTEFAQQTAEDLACPEEF